MYGLLELAYELVSSICICCNNTLHSLGIGHLKFNTSQNNLITSFLAAAYNNNIFTKCQK